MTAVPTPETRRPVLLLVVNVAWYFCLHRLSIALAAKKAGYDVHVAAAPDTPADAQKIRDAGLTFHPLQVRRGRWRPFEDLRLVGTLMRLNRELRPDIVHHITIKPVMFGTLAARLAGAPVIVNAMSGLGFVFTALGMAAVLRRKVVLFAYRVLFATRRVRVVFENSDDREMFLAKTIVRSEQAVVIRGVGVDTQRFTLTPEPSGVPAIVLPGRMLWDKGVREFCEAGAALRTKGIEARFALVGPLDPENPAAIPQTWLDEQVKRGHVEWWGRQCDMAAVYAKATIVCLPSYREGLPTVLLEAAACGRAAVTTDVPGCREVVVDEVTGLLVPARDSQALADALARVILDKDLRARLAMAAHGRVVSEMSEEQTTSRTLALYRSSLA